MPTNDTPTTPLDLPALLERCTPGEWLRDGTLVYALDETNQVNRFSTRIDGGYTTSRRRTQDSVRTPADELEANSELIKASRQIAEQLVALQKEHAQNIAELEKLRKQNEDLHEHIARYRQFTAKTAHHHDCTIGPDRDCSCGLTDLREGGPAPKPARHSTETEQWKARASMLSLDLEELHAAGMPHDIAVLMPDGRSWRVIKDEKDNRHNAAICPHCTPHDQFNDKADAEWPKGHAYLDAAKKISKIAILATRGKWQLQDGCSWRRIGTSEHDGNVLCPSNSRTDRHPDLTAGKDENLYANLGLIIALQNNLDLIINALLIASIKPGAVKTGATIADDDVSNALIAHAVHLAGLDGLFDMEWVRHWKDSDLSNKQIARSLFAHARTLAATQGPAG